MHLLSIKRLFLKLPETFVRNEFVKNANGQTKTDQGYQILIRNKGSSRKTNQDIHKLGRVKFIQTKTHFKTAIIAFPSTEKYTI